MRIFALLITVVALPFMLVIALFILLIDRNDALFTQYRVGKDKNEFKIYKFRTMDGTHITKFGNLLRSTGLDELPQLINIVKGDMQFIGPRPLTKSDITRLGWITPEHKARWSIKPGITGLAQLNKNCNADESIKLDLYYIEHQSLKLDLKILVKTLNIISVKKSKR